MWILDYLVLGQQPLKLSWKLEETALGYGNIKSFKIYPLLMESRFIENSMSQKKIALIDLLKDGIPRSEKEIFLAMNKYDTSDKTIKNYLKELTHNGFVKSQFVRRENEIRARPIYFVSDEEGRKVSFFWL
jgi:hypothetical protein